ncbi:hypothetical protein ACX80D_15025 [Arthrobacter sp. Sr24]
MTSDSFETLKRVVESESVAGEFFRAVLEWNVVELEEHPTGEGACVCGQQNLVKMFTIRNHKNGSELFPIGSHCVNHFGREDLNLQVTVFSDLFSLRKSILAGERITLTSEYFSRAVLKWLLDEGAFPADQWNYGNGENDYQFLLDMFNKRNKDELSRKQEAKIYQMLKYKVVPFVRDHAALGQ